MLGINVLNVKSFISKLWKILFLNFSSFFFFLIEKLDSTSEREFVFFKHPSENLKLIF